MFWVPGIVLSLFLVSPFLCGPSWLVLWKLIRDIVKTYCFDKCFDYESWDCSSGVTAGVVLLVCDDAPLSYRIATLRGNVLSFSKRSYMCKSKAFFYNVSVCLYSKQTHTSLLTYAALLTIINEGKADITFWRLNLRITVLLYYCHTEKCACCTEKYKQTTNRDYSLRKSVNSPRKCAARF